MSDNAYLRSIRKIEVQRKLEQHDLSRKRMSRFALGVSFFAFLLLLFNFGLMTAVVYLTKDTAVSNDGLMTNPWTGEPVKVHRARLELA